MIKNVFLFIAMTLTTSTLLAEKIPNIEFSVNEQKFRMELFDEDELVSIENLINELKVKYTTVEDEEFACACKLASHQLPGKLRKLLYDFSIRKLPDGHLLLRGFRIDSDAIGATPAHWDAPWNNTKLLREEIFQCLISSALGEIFGWRTQENGRYLRHIVPIEAEKKEQLGGSSDVVLLWHNEEAFHPQRADLMSIVCYRNEEGASTNLCPTSYLDIPAHYREILTQPRFYIKPDMSHSPDRNKSEHWNLSETHFNKIFEFLANPEHVSVITGAVGQESFRIDEAFMEALPGDQEAQEALNWLYNHMTERKASIVMEMGDILLIDNRIAAHGRSPYVPNYGPNARWLRRVNITTDLTKSYEWKDKPYGRVIF